MNNVALHIRERSLLYGDSVAMRVKREGAWIETTYAELDPLVETLARGLGALDVGVGDRVAVFSPNLPAWMQADLAIQSLRAASVPIYATSTADQARQIVEDADIAVAFAGTETQAAALAEVREACGLPRRIVSVTSPAVDPERDLDWADLLELGRARDGALTAERAAGAGLDDLATIIYTSGTTGEPKGVMLRHANFVNQFEHLDHRFRVHSDDRSLCFLPLSHVYERAWSFYVYLQGASNSFVVDPRTVSTLLPEVKPSVMVAVPRLYEKIHTVIHQRVESGPPLRRRLFHWATAVGGEYQRRIRDGGAGPWLKLRHAVADRLVLKRIRDAVGGDKNVLSCGGAPLASEIEEFFLATGLLICQGYGLTETAPMLTCNTPDDFRFGSVGKPIVGVEIRTGEDGEIQVRGPNVSEGYFGRPEATSEAFVDGWFRTGDVGHFDEDGFLVVTDRLKDLIVTSGGKNVAPQKVEIVVGQDPYVEQLAVIGDRRKFLGALVVPSFDALKEWAARKRLAFKNHDELIKLPEVISFMDERIRERCRHLPPFERVRRFTLLNRPFSMELGEMTPTLKVRRKVIAATFRDMIDRMFV